MFPKTWDNYGQLRIDSRIVFYNQSLQKINNTKWLDRRTKSHRRNKDKWAASWQNQQNGIIA